MMSLDDTINLADRYLGPLGAWIVQAAAWAFIWDEPDHRARRDCRAVVDGRACAARARAAAPDTNTNMDQ